MIKKSYHWFVVAFLLFGEVVAAVMTVVGAAAVGKPAAADPFMPFAENGMQDGSPPIVDDKQNHTDQVFETSPGEIKNAEHNCHETAMAVALAGQLDVITSTFRTSWI